MDKNYEESLGSEFDDTNLNDVEITNPEYKKLMEEFSITDFFMKDRKQMFDDSKPLTEDKVLSEAKERAVKKGLLGTLLDDAEEFKKNQEDFFETNEGDEEFRKHIGAVNVDELPNEQYGN